MIGRAFLAFLALAAVGGLFGLRAIAGDAAPRQNQVLPYGEVDWQRGYVKVSAIGLPPFGSSGALTPQEVARQNAVSLAQKRLLGVILDLEVKHRKVRDHLSVRSDMKERLRALVTTAQVQGRSYSDGSVEITLTLPVTGTGGLDAFLTSF
ncbi:MAG: hypothetical protein ACLGIN_00500 [Candidatus Sericytochromatia bacterium]